MKLLIQEFFGKIFKFSEAIAIGPLAIIINLLYKVIFISLIIVVYYLYRIKRYDILIGIIVFWLVGETAHFLRKKMEKKAINFEKENTDTYVVKKVKKKISINKNLLD